MSENVRIGRASKSKNIPSNKELRAWAAAALQAGGKPRASLGLRVAGAAECRRLNARYRNRDYATNVLSFQSDLTLPEGAAWLGDIVICAPVVAREARAQAKRPSAHWAHMVIHGVLHLLGHDHLRPRQAARMEALERRILAQFRISDPYR